MAVYDTAKLRHIASLVRQVTSSMEADVEPAIRKAAASLEPLKGRTARAMDDGLAQMRKQAAGLRGEYETLAYLINTYADMLERADRELAEKL